MIFRNATSRRLKSVSGIAALALVGTSVGTVYATTASSAARVGTPTATTTGTLTGTTTGTGTPTGTVTGTLTSTTTTTSTGTTTSTTTGTATSTGTTTGTATSTGTTTGTATSTGTATGTSTGTGTGTQDPDEPCEVSPSVLIAGDPNGAAKDVLRLVTEECAVGDSISIYKIRGTKRDGNKRLVLVRQTEVEEGAEMVFKIRDANGKKKTRLVAKVQGASYGTAKSNTQKLR
jgi:hypothetical protein